MLQFLMGGIKLFFAEVFESFEMLQMLLLPRSREAALYQQVRTTAPGLILHCGSIRSLAHRGWCGAC